MLIKYLTRREKFMVVFTVCLIPIIVYFNFFYLPLVTEIKRTKVFIINNNLNINRKNHLSLKQNVNIHKPTKIIPNMENNTEIAYNIKKTTLNCGVELENLSFGEFIECNDEQAALLKESKRKLVSDPVSIIISGSNGNLVNFIKQVESDNRLCSISDIGIKETSTCSAIATLSLNYYFFDGGE